MSPHCKPGRSSRAHRQTSTVNSVNISNKSLALFRLPEQLRQPDITLGQFKRSLKTFVWLVGPRRLVSERQGRWLEIFLLTYLFTDNLWQDADCVINKQTTCPRCQTKQRERCQSRLRHIKHVYSRRTVGLQAARDGYLPCACVRACMWLTDIASIYTLLQLDINQCQSISLIYSVHRKTLGQRTFYAERR